MGRIVETAGVTVTTTVWSVPPNVPLTVTSPSAGDAAVGRYGRAGIRRAQRDIAVPRDVADIAALEHSEDRQQKIGFAGMD